MERRGPAGVAVSLLLDAAGLDARRAPVAGPLASLAESLRHDLQRVIRADPHPAAEKALLSRDGGRCPRDASSLSFDPFSPRHHRCPTCGESFRGARHDRWWVMGYQLWLAERAVHAAALGRLTADDELSRFAADLVLEFAERYLSYPNQDNVLGPTRLFFSTYLESIWLLQICIALDLLESGGMSRTLGYRVRDRLIEPSAALIGSYDEGMSNRQTWNNAALLAAHLLLDRPVMAEEAVHGPSGLIAQLDEALLADGSWYEGENYHLFAHRGLWYGVTMAQRAQLELPANLEGRFEEGFAMPLATALPDFTFPSRRDSQYGVTLRQWRFAESCELGLARRDDPRLCGALWELYERPLSTVGDSGRWRSTAEAERNEPPTRLTRSDLGWRSLLFARATLPKLAPPTPGSALLEGQGLAVLRRDNGRVYAALDYGHSGGGHGHPDRLNLILANGSDRWLDDMGTGSYVDPSLYWYRSTLAHNAPLVNGYSQLRAHGVLRAYDDREGVTWVEAEVPRDGIAAGVRVSRTLVAMDSYLVDELRWESEQDVTLDLPFHVDATADGLEEWRAASLTGGKSETDGFRFLHDTASAAAPWEVSVNLALRSGGGEAWVLSSTVAHWWRASAPGPPGTGARAFFVVRTRGRSGIITTVWSWARRVLSASSRDGLLVVRLADRVRHHHARRAAGWHIDRFDGKERSSIDLGGLRPAPAPRRYRAAPEDSVPALLYPGSQSDAGGLRFHLGEETYRRSEDSWEEAGRPSATVTVRASRLELIVEVEVHKAPLVFRPAEAPDPSLDNEHPDIHSDGVQLYVRAPGWPQPAGWLAVPVPGGSRVRVHEIDGMRQGLPLSATWKVTPTGYAMRFFLALSSLGPGPEYPLLLDVLVNEMGRDRERRRGQLAMSGSDGGFVYLRGDRHEPERMLPFRVTSD
ncbi:MAG: heparinase II/III-family protein [Gemmatimonadota bacterium]|nr:heparinase II/III-family protein [Gemmatimonadota bacterium]